MQEFIQKIREILESMGITNIKTNYSTLWIGDVEFSFYRPSDKRKKGYEIYGDGYKDCRTPIDGVQFILTSLPKKRKQTELAKKRQAMHDNVNKINAQLDGTNCKVSSEMDGEEGQEVPTYYLNFKHHDLETIMAAIVYLQDNWFNDNGGEKLKEDGFCISQIMFLMKFLSFGKQQELYLELGRKLTKEAGEIK